MALPDCMDLPFDTWLLILQFLPSCDIFERVVFVSRFFRDVVECESARGRLVLTTPIIEWSPELLAVVNKYQFKGLTLGDPNCNLNNPGKSIPSLDALAEDTLLQVRSLSLNGQSSEVHNQKLCRLKHLEVHYLDPIDANILGLVSDSLPHLKTLNLNQLHYPIPSIMCTEPMKLQELLVSERIRYTVWDNNIRHQLFAMIQNNHQTLKRLELRVDKGTLPTIFNRVVSSVPHLEVLLIEIANTTHSSKMHTDPPERAHNLKSLTLNCPTKDVYWLICQGEDFLELENLTITSYMGLHSISNLWTLVPRVKFPKLKSLYVSAPKRQIDFLFQLIPSTLAHINIKCITSTALLSRFNCLETIHLSNIVGGDDGMKTIIENNSNSLAQLNCHRILSNELADLVLACPNLHSLKCMSSSGLKRIAELRKDLYSVHVNLMNGDSINCDVDWRELALVTALPEYDFSWMCHLTRLTSLHLSVDVPITFTLGGYIQEIPHLTHLSLSIKDYNGSTEENCASKSRNNVTIAKYPALDNVHVTCEEEMNLHDLIMLVTAMIECHNVSYSFSDEVTVQPWFESLWTLLYRVDKPYPRSIAALYIVKYGLIDVVSGWSDEEKQFICHLIDSYGSTNSCERRLSSLDNIEPWIRLIADAEYTSRNNVSFSRANNPEF